MRRTTDLHQPVQKDGPHLGLQVRVFLHHVDVSGVGLIFLQHVAPHHIFTGPTGQRSTGEQR